MASHVSTERRLWTGALLNALLILLMAPYGRALQHIIESYVGKKISIVFTVFIILCGIVIFYKYVFQQSSRRVRRLLLFSIVCGFYTWRLATLHVQVERFHLIEYGILAGMVCLAIQQKHPDWSSVGWGFASAWFVGLLDELFQWWWPTRVGEWRDVVINMQSGALGLAATVLLFRERIRFRSPSRAKIALLLSAFSLLSLLSGAFILKVHAFGFRHVDPSIGTFYSAFTLDDLRNATVDSYLDNVKRAGGHQKEKFITDVYLYFYEREAKEHFDRVHLLVELDKIPEAWSEYHLTNRYYKPWLEGTDRAFPDRISTRLDSADPPDSAKFTSPVMNWLMVSVSQRDVHWIMWTCAIVFMIPVVIIRFRLL